MYTLTLQDSEAPLYIIEQNDDFLLTSTVTDKPYQAKNLADVLAVQNGFGIGTENSPVLSPEINGTRTKLAKVEVVIKAVQIDDEMTLENLHNGTVKVLNTDDVKLSVTVGTQFPHYYCTTEETRRQARKNRDLYRIVKLPKSQELDPKPYDKIYGYSPYSATGFNNMVYHLVEPADMEELLENHDVDAEKYDYFIATKVTEVESTPCTTQVVLQGLNLEANSNVVDLYNDAVRRLISDDECSMETLVKEGFDEGALEKLYDIEMDNE